MTRRDVPERCRGARAVMAAQDFRVWRNTRQPQPAEDSWTQVQQAK